MAEYSGDASADAAKLREAMKGWGTNEQALIDVLGTTSADAMQHIKKAYSADFKRDLVDDLKSEVRGDFEDVLVALCDSQSQYDARLVRNAVKGLGTDEDLLCEILCTRTNEDLKAADAAYKAMFDETMMEAVQGDTSGDLKDIYTKLISGSQNDDGADVEADVKTLFDAGENKWGTDEAKIIEIFTGRTRKYRDELYHAYGKAHGKALDDVIESEMSGDAKRALKMLITPVPVTFSKMLKETMDGAGTNDKQLIRIICSQKERQLKEIEQRFLEDNKRSISTWVEADCGGDYKKILVKLLKTWA